MTNDYPLERKKLSLKGRRSVKKILDTNKPSVLRSELVTEEWQKELLGLENLRKALKDKIAQIERRLVFGYSDALRESCVELKKKDMQLNCKITDILVKNF